MIFIILAGILNGMATIFLKISNKNELFIFISMFFFSANFLFFRLGLQKIKVESGYTVLITTSLITLLFFNIYTKNTLVNTQLFFAVTLFIVSLFLFSHKNFVETPVVMRSLESI